MEMERFSPKIEIINHFDNLINRIDINIDSYLEKINDQILLSEIVKSSEDNRWLLRNIYKKFNVEFFNKIDSSNQNLESWPESTKMVDYLKQVLMKTIEELRNEQEKTLEYYKLNSERFKSELTNKKSIEEMKSELFTDKFYFQVNLKQSENILWPFNVYTFVTDFYISQSYIDSLEKLINSEREPFGRDCIFDDKMVLTGLLYKCFIENLSNLTNHVIHVRKKDVLNIKSIAFIYQISGVNLTISSIIDLSKLEELNLVYIINTRRSELVKINIEGLSSLKTFHLRANTLEFEFSIHNLPSLTSFYLSISSFGRNTIDERILTRLLNQIPHIQELHLDAKLSYLNLDNLVNLRVLSLYRSINENFNLELFKNLCDKLEYLTISLANIDEKTFYKLFDGYNFPNLVDFTVRYLNIKRLTKEFINRLPKPRNKLNITDCQIKVIESDSFSNIQQLSSLDLRRNEIEFIEENAFSSLNNLQTLDLSFNRLTNFDPKFVGLIESAEYKNKK